MAIYREYIPSVIGTMNTVCTYCKAMKFKNEAPGICCVNGKVNLPTLNSPPQPLNSLVSGTAAHSKHFLTNIQKYNSLFQMTSFGATNIIRQNYHADVQGKIFNRRTKYRSRQQHQR